LLTLKVLPAKALPAKNLSAEEADAKASPAERITQCRVVSPARRKDSNFPASFAVTITTEEKTQKGWAIGLPF
jgi:hypothetical protein